MKVCLFSALTVLAFLTLAPALATELPSGRADPDKRLQSCDAYGAGFVFSPAINACIKVSGSFEGEVAATHSHR